MANHTHGVCVQEKQIFWKIQNNYFYFVPYSNVNKTLYMKAFQYKMYFTHIDSLQILKSLEDIQVFLAKRWVNLWLFWFV
jgi:hypothetical protein